MPKESFIVTGGAGFIGCNLTQALFARGHEDILVVDDLNHLEKGHNILALGVHEYLDKQAFREAFRAGRIQPPTTVFHLGACSATTETNEAYLMDNNLAYTQELCRWCLDNNVRFIYASSAATYGDGTLGYSDDDAITPTLKPLNLYGHSKQRFDLWALEQKLLGRIAGLKYFNVYGPHEDHKGDMRSVVNKAYAEILASGRLNLFKSHRPDYADGEQDRDFIHVNDAVAVTLYFHDHPEVSGLFNCGTGQARTWIDLAHAIFHALHRPIRIDMVDMPEAIRDKYQYHTQADLTKLRQTGCSAPAIAIEEGVADYVAYLKQRKGVPSPSEGR